MANTSTLDIKIFENVHGVLNNLTGTLTKANTAVVGLTSSVTTLATSFSQITNAVQNVDSSAETAVDKLLKLRSSVANGLKNFADGIIYVHGLGEAIEGLNSTTTLTGKVFQPVMDGVKKGLQIGMGAFNSYRTQVIAARGAIASTTGAARVLNIVMAASPWGLAIAGVTALCVGIYKLMDGASEATRHYKKLNESLAKMNSNIIVEEIALDRLFRRLDNAKEGTEEWNKIRNEINDKYADYLKNMGIEIQNTKDAKIAYDGLKKSIHEVNKAKFVKKQIEEADDKYGEIYGESRGKILAAIIKEVGDRKKGTELFNELMEKHGTGEKLSPELKKIVGSFRIPSNHLFTKSILKLFDIPVANETIITNLQKLGSNEKRYDEELERIFIVYDENPENYGYEPRKKPKKPTVTPIAPSFHLPQRGSTSFMRDPFNFIDSSPSVNQQLWNLPKYRISPFNPVSNFNRDINVKNEVTVNVSNSNGQSGEILGTQFAQAFVKEVSESLTSLA